MRIFEIDVLSETSIVSYREFVDKEHLRRRDYNLVPYQFEDGHAGYFISSGVFRADADLPFTYPVTVDGDGYYPIEEFYQLLSHYHSPKLSIYDEVKDELHMIFFRGLAQYYYNGDEIIKDNDVPFVQTISVVTRDSEGAFTEKPLDVVMPGYEGTSAEFIPNKELSHNQTGVFLVNDIKEYPVLMGHIIRGIISPAIDPFSSNRTNQTSASSNIYRVWLNIEE